MANLVDLFGGLAFPLAEPVASARRYPVVGAAVDPRTLQGQ